MLFNSYEFLIFFPIVVLVYFLIPYRVKHIWLLAASYYFYMCWNMEYALLLLFSTAITYVCGRVIANIGKNQKGHYRLRQKITIAIGIIMNLALLFFFKYYQFASNMILQLSSALNIHIQIPSFDVILPVGISFYTFQAIGYIVDVYRGDVPAERNFFRYALFISFFPQLVAGPIERAKNIMKQLSRQRRFDFERAVEGLLVMLWGYFLKVVIADRIAIFVDNVYGNIASADGIHLIVATVLFAIQIYCDFYGYSTIAVGAANVLGIKLMDNFNAPYLSISVSEFWQNWHISLTNFFRDYLYIPLGGNRKGKLRTYVNRLFVFLCSGLWHGASMNFIVWGGINGLYQIISDIISPIKNKLYQKLHINRKTILYTLFAGVTTFVLIDFSWIFFRARSLSDAMTVINRIFTQTHSSALTNGSLFTYGLSMAEMLFVVVSIAILLAGDACRYNNIVIHQWLNERKWLCWPIIGLSIFLIMLFGVWGPEYNHANFIYFQF